MQKQDIVFSISLNVNNKWLFTNHATIFSAFSNACLNPLIYIYLHWGKNKIFLFAYGFQWFSLYLEEDC